MIHFVLVFIKWIITVGIAFPIMFLFGVKAFDQWAAGEFKTEAEWLKKVMR